jgi:hypothetical protein
LNVFSSRDRVGFILDPFSRGDWIRIWLYPFDVFLSERILRNVLYKSLFNRRLIDELSEVRWNSKRSLWNEFYISVLLGRRLVNFYMF